MKKKKLFWIIFSIVLLVKGVLMFHGLEQSTDFSLYKTRRNELIKAIGKEFPTIKKGAVLLFGDFEHDRLVFRQESSFYYLTGIEEPGVVLLLDLQGKATLYVPNVAAKRAQWMASTIELSSNNASRLGFDEITNLGHECEGYQIHPFFPRAEYEFLLAKIQSMVHSGEKLFVLSPANAYEYIGSRLMLERLASYIPDLKDSFVDISSLVAQQRRIKDMHEIECLYKAVEITAMAQEAAAQAIGDGVLECEVQAGIEYIYTATGGRKGFPSIVGSGKNTTVLHYVVNSGTMKNGDLVVVDIGAAWNNYCADLTRTYPVSGQFTERQKEIYNLVLATQEYIAGIAKPGYWLKNPEHPEKSLHHLAHKYLKEHGGYDIFFVHGLGHYLGLDVHDVGDYTKPLQEGDVFTIEPGIYIPAERIGVRIEDDYWVVKDGVICLSESLPKKAEDIEALVQQNFSNPDEQPVEGFQEEELGES